jgi:hypothetical protein
MLCNEFLNLKGGFKKLEPPLFSRISSQPFFRTCLKLILAKARQWRQGLYP